MKKYWWVFVLAAPALSITLVSLLTYYLASIWTYSGPDIVFEVRPGEGFSSINGRLNRQGLISSAKLFHRYSQFQNIMTKFKSGAFVIKSGSNLLEVAETLTQGKAITTTITIPEGKNIFEIGKILENSGVIDAKSFIAAAKSSEIINKLKIPGERVEGYLYPETYHFSKGTSAGRIIGTMVHQFHKKVKGLALENNPMDLNPHQVIIMASIVEKETGAGHERPMIAGVFLNRLKKGMRLQSDPTTIYGIYENYNGNLRKKHLLERTPYNTYKVSGLPKGPISNPGLDSIKAVLDPTPHQYLYFVSQNDGTHIFSKSYKEHREAVNKFQKDKNARKGKSWRDLKKAKKE